MPAHCTARVAAASLVLALGLGIAMVLGGRLLLPRLPAATLAEERTKLGGDPSERG